MITNYTELQQTIASWLDRTDLDGYIPDFISVADARFARKIRHWRMEKRAVANTTAGINAIPVPDDYIEIRNLKTNANFTDVLEFLPPAKLYEGLQNSGPPQYYTIQGKNMLLRPIPNSNDQIEINYYAFQPLSDDNPTNWLLTEYPDIYLYGSLVAAEGFIIRDQRIPMWKTQLDEALKELDRNDQNARWNGSPLKVRV